MVQEVRKAANSFLTNKRANMNCFDTVREPHSTKDFFSTIKRVETYLRIATGDDRLSYLMLMYVES